MAKKSLRISPDIALPFSVVTATTVVYGGKGMGKTNFGAVLVEELAVAGLRWAVIDPMGVWWGMRYSADGKGAGVECLILGGAHGDIPIEPTGGAVVADLVADHNVSVILDISRKANGEMWSIGERIRFTTEYGKQLFKRQGALVDGRRREPILQVIDEAARFLPQTIRSGDIDAAKCESVWSTIVEEGRNIGIGVVLLTQRSARLNKNVAELADLMLAFRTVGPNSIAAVIDWLGEHISKDRMKEMVGELRSLPRGSALAVSPGWLQVEKIVPIRMRTTFDSSATPKPGEKAARVRGEGAKPDLGVYATRMRETIERAAADDPKALRKRIAELEAAAKKISIPDAPTALNEKDQETIAMLKEKLDALGAEIESIEGRVFRMKQKLATARSVAEQLVQTLSEDDVDAVVGDFVTKLSLEARSMMPKVELIAAKSVSRSAIPAKAVTAQQPASAASGDLTPARQRILEGLAMGRSIGRSPLSRLWVAIFAGASSKSSAFTNNLGALRTAGLIDYVDGKVQLTDLGAGKIMEPERLSRREIHELLLNHLQPAQRRIMAVLLPTGTATISREDLAGAAGASHTSSAFTNNLGALRSLGMIDYGANKTVHASDELFL